MKALEYFFSSLDYQKVNSACATFYEDEHCFIPYYVNSDIVYCPYRSSFTVVEGDLNRDSFTIFLQSLASKAKEIRWILPPNSYPKSKDQLAFLLYNKLKINQIEISQHIDLEEDFIKNLSYSKRKKLKDFELVNVKTKQVSMDYFDSCYDMIAKNRAQKGFPLTVERAKLKELLTAFPDNFFLYATFIEGDLAACSVTIKLSETVLYQFYWAHDVAYNDKCPLAHLNFIIACTAKEKDYKILDFGVSSVGGKINRGLYQFKKELGAKPTKKYYLNYLY